MYFKLHLRYLSSPEVQPLFGPLVITGSLAGLEFQAAGLERELVAYLGHALGESVLGHEGHLDEVGAAGSDEHSRYGGDEHSKYGGEEGGDYEGEEGVGYDGEAEMLLARELAAHAGVVGSAVEIGNGK